MKHFYIVLVVNVRLPLPKVFGKGCGEDSFFKKVLPAKSKKNSQHPPTQKRLSKIQKKLKEKIKTKKVLLCMILS